jgi:hypothetical protein
MDRIRLSREPIRASANLARPCETWTDIIFTEGCASMRVRCLAQIVSAFVLPAAIVALMPDTAFALGHHQYASTMEYDAAAGYAVPIQDVYQFPAAQVYQLGVQVPVAPGVPLFIRVGDHHVLER